MTDSGWLDAIEAREERASRELGEVCAEGPAKRWRWTIPANPEHDTDLIVADSLADIPALVARVRCLGAKVAAVDALLNAAIGKGELIDPDDLAAALDQKESQ